MKWMLDIEIKSPVKKINYNDNILVIGSCFTEHIGGRLQELKFNVLQNPNGILFDPLSVASSLGSYVSNKQYTAVDLFFLNDVWQSWAHHSRFSGMLQEAVLTSINQSQQQAYEFIKKTDWLIITLGSAFSYQLKQNNGNVANCHRAPAQLFNKTMVEISEIIESLSTAVLQALSLNPNLKTIFTISPVRHIRDGVVENNRSKARLIEAINVLLDRFENAWYFPAYELVIDILRDYRFYDIDLVHPNYAATEFVFEKFTKHYIDDESQTTMEDVKKLVTAYKHKPFHASTNAHKAFLKKSLDNAKELQEKYPAMNFIKEIGYFMGTM